jgi:purine-binding chemotaxis protein CheW
MSQGLPADEIARILQNRARALAKPLEEPSAQGETLDLLVFRLAGERYGIDAAHVLEVVQLPELVPVPCTPPVVLGVVNHRGRVLAILDLRRLFDLAGHESSKASHAVIVEAAGMTFGVFSDAVEGLVRVGADEVGPPPVSLKGVRQAFIRGVTGEMVAVLDLESLARDPRITVKDAG